MGERNYSDSRNVEVCNFKKGFVTGVRKIPSEKNRRLAILSQSNGIKAMVITALMVQPHCNTCLSPLQAECSDKVSKMEWQMCRLADLHTATAFSLLGFILRTMEQNHFATVQDSLRFSCSILFYSSVFEMSKEHAKNKEKPF